jgi:hypothetical protein
VHGDIRLPPQQSGFELVGEKSLSAPFFERPLQPFIARGDNPELLGLHAECRVQMRRHHCGLGKSERTFPGGEDELGHGQKKKQRTRSVNSGFSA